MDLLFALFLPSLRGLRGASPDAAVVLAAVGVCLIFLELNRPGSILPGAVGLLLVLLAVSALSRSAIQPWALVLLLGSAGALLLNVWYKVQLWLLVLATLTLTAGIRFLVPPMGARGVHTPVALACGVAVGALGAFLSRVALRARRAKRVN